MKQITNTLLIEAAPQAVYDAIATEAGIKGWWTEFSSVESRVGGHASFAFPSHEVEKIAVIEALEPGKRVAWKIIEHRAKHPDWKNTLVDFRLEACDGGTAVSFSHAGWPAKSEIFGQCVNGWAYFMASLKKYCETGEGTPVKEAA